VDTTDAGPFFLPLSGGYGSHLLTRTLCEGSGLKAEKWIRSTRSIGVSQAGRGGDGSRDQSGLGTCGNYFTSRRRGKVSHSPIEHSAAAFSTSFLVNSYSECSYARQISRTLCALGNFRCLDCDPSFKKECSERLDGVPLSSREAPIQFFFIKAVQAVRNLPCYWVQIHVKDKVVTVALQKCRKWRMCQ